MTPSHPTIHPSRWYAPLALLACLASLQALLLPRWPRAAELPQPAIENALRSSGLDGVPLQSIPAQRSFALSSSDVLQYKLKGGENLQLVNITVRERLKFDMPTLTSKLPSLNLQVEQTSPQPPYYTIGLIEGRPARQTCFIAGLPGPAAFAVNIEQFWYGVDTIAREDPRESLLRLAGLANRRSYRCTLITLRAARGHPLSDGQWQTLLKVIRPVLERGMGPRSAKFPDHLLPFASPPHG